jgi:hypothetical protein
VAFWAAAAAARPGPALLYLEPDLEVRLSAALQRLPLARPLLRLGVAEASGSYYGAVQFLGRGLTRAQLRRQTLQMLEAGFRTLPQMVQLDIVALQDREPAGKRPFENWCSPGPNVLFTFSARRPRDLAFFHGRDPGPQLASLGEAWFAERVPPDPPCARTAALALAQAFEGGCREALGASRKGIPPPALEP